MSLDWLDCDTELLLSRLSFVSRLVGRRSNLRLFRLAIGTRLLLLRANEIWYFYQYVYIEN